MSNKINYSFIGKPTKEYPDGRVYTIDLVMKKSGVKRYAAILRIKKALKDPSQEGELLKPNKKARISYNIPTPEEFTPEQRKRMKQFRDVADGKLSINEMLEY